MITPKKFALLVAMLSVFSAGWTQTVKIKKENAGVKNASVAGCIVSLEGTPAEINAAFVKYLKGFGKVKQGDVLTVSEPTVVGIKYTSSLFGITQAKDNGATAWLGFDRTTLTKEQIATLDKDVEKMLYEFGIQYYRNKIQVQVDESSRAAQAVDRQQQKLTNEGKALATRLEDNKREKIQLEKSLENNRIENATLLKKIEKNKHDQDSVALAATQVKKVVEMHREKQRKVN
jgi:hypothetical protein